MAITVKLQNLKITARKVRLVANLVRNKSVDEAEAILRFTSKKASLPMLKLLQSAKATVKNTYKKIPPITILQNFWLTMVQCQNEYFPVLVAAPIELSNALRILP